MAPNQAPPPAARSPFRPANPLVIGITGGIAAGKSTVAKLFRSHGLTHVDADFHARAVAADATVIRLVEAEFGAGVLRGGALDREALARLVFADADSRARLEAILHPRIRARILADLAAARARGDSVLLDAPLLFETGLVDCCDHTVHIETALATRQARAAERGWPAGELQRREAAQIPLAVKKQRAVHTIDNDDDLESAARGVAAALDKVVAASR